MINRLMPLRPNRTYADQRAELRSVEDDLDTRERLLASRARRLQEQEERLEARARAVALAERRLARAATLEHREEAAAQNLEATAELFGVNPRTNTVMSDADQLVGIDYRDPRYDPSAVASAVVAADRRRRNETPDSPASQKAVETTGFSDRRAPAARPGAVRPLELVDVRDPRYDAAATARLVVEADRRRRGEVA